MKEDLKISVNKGECKMCAEEKGLCQTHREFVRAKEAASILKISASTLYQYKKDGMIDCFRIVRPNKRKGVALWPKDQVYRLLNLGCSGNELN